MALFDSIISEVASRFGLGDKAGTLVSALMSLISSEQGGGITGFIDKFKQAGLGDLVSSWISTGANEPLEEKHVESVLGADALNSLAAQSGLSLDKVKPALAFLIPTLIDKLTPSGVIPSSLPSLSSLLSGVTGAATGAVGAATGAVGGAAGAAAGAVGGAASAARAGAARAASEAAEAVTGGGGGLLKLLPLLLLGLLIYLGYQYCNRAHTPEVKTVIVAPTPAPINSTLSLINADGKVKVTGIVPDEATRQKILADLTAAYGAGKFEANITVNPAAKPAGWLAKLADVLKEFKIPGAELSFDGDAIKIGGVAAAAALVDKLKGLFGGGFNVIGNFLDVNAAVAAANAKAQAALAALTGGASADAVVQALNLQIINFASGRADIPAANQALLKKAAEVLKGAPAGTKFEVGGHTDSKGAAAGNLKLSQARAAAVAKYLTGLGVKADQLVAKGFGPDRPVASNDTEEGRFKNRRIEFAVVR